MSDYPTSGVDGLWGFALHSVAERQLLARKHFARERHRGLREKAVSVERDGPFEIAHSEGDGVDGGFHAVQSKPRAAGGRRGLSARRR